MGWDNSDQKLMRETIDRIIPVLEELNKTFLRFAEAVERIEVKFPKETTDDE